MKLATIRNGHPDGRLVLVSRDLSRACDAHDIAGTLQEALERWAVVAPALERRAAALEAAHEPGGVVSTAFVPSECLAPLPRAWQWLDGSAFPSHGALMQVAFGLAPIESAAPLMYQGMSHEFLAGHEDVQFPSEADGIDFEGEFGVLTDAVPMGTAEAAAGAHIRLVVLINDWSLRRIAPIEMKTGFGWIQAKPACSVAPVAVTPDELGDAWAHGRVHAVLAVDRGGESFGRAFGGAMEVGFPALVAHAAATRRLCAGTIIGSGTVSNEDHRVVGSSCISERRAAELVDHGAPRTPFLRFGEAVRMEVTDAAGRSVFGAIDQRVVRLGGDVGS